MRKCTLLLFVLMATMLNAHNPGTPDFAFPKTVSKDAMSDLRVAEKDNDPAAAVNALLRYYVAETRISPSDFPAQTLDLVKNASVRFADTDLAGIFDILQARIYQTYSEMTLTGRDVPVHPLPADVSEWSREQLAYVADSLFRQACTGAKAARLAGCPLDRYQEFIEIPQSYTAEFFPTLLDFARCCAVKGMRNTGYTIDRADGSSRIKPFVQEIVRECPTVSAPWYFWSVEALNPGNSPELEQLRTFIDTYPNSLYAGYAISQCVGKLPGGGVIYSASCMPDSAAGTEAVADDDFDDPAVRKRWFVDVADSYLRAWPESPFAPAIRMQRDELLVKDIEITFSEYCYPGVEFPVQVTNTNVGKCTVSVYRYNGTQEDPDAATVQRYVGKHRPLHTVTLETADKAPFTRQDTVRFTVPECGRYLVYADYEGMRDYTHDLNKRGASRGPSVELLDCRTLLPVTVDGVAPNRVFVVNPVDGMPEQGVTVKVLNGDNAPATVTDSRGVAAVSPQSDWRATMQLTRGGQSFIYKGTVPRTPRDYTDTDDRYNASVITDRALYHPGDTLHYLTVTGVWKPVTKASAPASGAEVTVELLNRNYQTVATADGTADEFGRFHGSLAIPTDGLTGRFSLAVRYGGRQIGNGYITVSDYKMPDFEITSLQAARNVPAEGCVTLSGKASTYSGMPLAGVGLNITVRGGRWWNAYELVNTIEGTTADDGTFSVVLDPEFFSRNPERFMWYQALVEGVSPSGTTASASTSFTLGKEYSLTVDSDPFVDALKPYSPTITVRDSRGNEVPMQLKWEIIRNKVAVASGELSSVPGTKPMLDLKTLTPDVYTIKVSAADESLADPATEIISLYNTDTDIVPTDSPLWLCGSSATAGSDGKAEILYGTTAESTYIYIITNFKGKDYILDTVRAPRGYHRHAVAMPDTASKAVVKFVCVKDWDVCQLDYTVSLPARPALTLACESFRDRLVPTATETWKFTVKGADGKGADAALVLDMYNKALDALTPHSISLRFPDYRPYYSSRLLFPYNGQADFNVPGISPNPLAGEMPEFVPEMVYSRYLPFYSPYWHDRYDYVMVRTYKRAMARETVQMASDDVYVEDYASMPDNMIMATVASGAMMDIEEAEEGPDGGGEDTDGTFDFRDAHVPLAIWAPALSTDADGNLAFTFTVPNAVTTWQLQALAWDKSLATAGLRQEFVASKPVMVQPNLPRFLRRGDRAVLRALVMNNTDSTTQARVVTEIFNPADGRVTDKSETLVELAPNASATVSVTVDVPASAAALGYRVRAISGACSDGEQAVVPVLSNDAALIETTPFYLNPGDSLYSTTLPKGRDMRLTLTFCENPVWTVVSALPGLRTQISEYANSASAAIFSALAARGIVSSNPAIGNAVLAWLQNPDEQALVSMLEKNEDLKAAVLNSTPWVQAAQSDSERMANLALIFDDKEIASSISQATAILEKLQRGDGGWAWGSWCDNSSVWVTENVLSMVYDLRRYGWWTADTKLDGMVRKALAYLDKNVKDTDLTYAIIRGAFTEAAVSGNGKKVIGNTISDIKKGWKNSNSLYYKGLAAMAAYNNGERGLAREIMRSASEYGVRTKGQGIVYPSTGSLASYCALLEAYALIDPGCPEIDGLRQQLIVRKQATDWGSAVVTTEVVAAILSSGSEWTVQATGATVEAGTTPVRPDNPIESATGSLRADLTPYAGETLTVHTPGTGPAYGAVYAQYSRLMDKVKASGIDDLTIEKKLFVRNGGGWDNVKALKVGDRVKVQLTIHCKRDMQYVTVVDERPATFEPVQQLPGWVYCDGASFYRENRDSRTGLYISYLRRGTYQITYEMDVNNAGTFSSGVATIQSQYAPELTAHSSGCLIQVGE